MRIAEALSKMKLQPFATEADVEEALRLFQVSTLDAALSGTLSGEQTQGPRLGWLVGSVGRAHAGHLLCLLLLCVASPCFLLGISPSPVPSPHQPVSPKMGRTASLQTLEHNSFDPVQYYNSQFYHP